MFALMSPEAVLTVFCHFYGMWDIPSISSHILRLSVPCISKTCRQWLAEVLSMS